MRTFIFIIMLGFVVGAWAVDSRLLTIAYKDGLAVGWVTKINDAVNDTMGFAEGTDRCMWRTYTNAVGETWYATTFWADIQFNVTNSVTLKNLIDIKVPKPFADDILCLVGVPEDSGMMPVGENP